VTETTGRRLSWWAWSREDGALGDALGVQARCFRHVAQACDGSIAGALDPGVLVDGGAVEA
jgi:hypothetical protein